MDNMADADLTVSLLIPLDSAHRNNGAFRIITYGGETDTVPILVEDLFPSPPRLTQGSVRQRALLHRMHLVPSKQHGQLVGRCRDHDQECRTKQKE
jgi:hypothetical protein